MVWNVLRRHPLLVDAAIVLTLGAGYVGNAGHRHGWAGAPLLAVLQVAPLLVRRRYPLAVLAAASTATAAFYLIYASNFPPFPVAFAIYTAAVQLDRRTSLRASGLAAALLLVCAAAKGEAGQLIGITLLLVAGWVIGDNIGTRRAYTRALEERAERLEREQETERARAVAEEQARIARELHDVLAHNVSVMVVQAAAANDVFEARPERAREALQAIEATGRTALGELRRLLSAVRGDGAEYAPQPGLDRLDELVAQVRTAGLDVSVSLEGTPRAIPPGIDLSAYRVVQEALTNTLKHAHATHANVSIRYGDDELGIDVRDDGTSTGNGDGTGHGLLGMRERVATFGGSLDVGPAPHGGFEVAATFPL